MRVTIFSSSSVEDKKYLTLAHEVASYLASKKYELVCGGVASSMMLEIYNEFKKKNLNVTCYTLDCYKEDLVCSNTLIYNQTFDRLKNIYNNTDLFIALPGGTGSLTEIFGCLEEIRTQDKNKKIIIFNYNNFYMPIINFIDKLIENGFNNKEIKDYIVIANNIDELKKKVSELYE